MRKFIFVAALVAGVAWAGSAHAQTTSSSQPNIFNIIKFPSNMNINVQPNITNNSPMDYRNQMAPIGSTLSNPPNNGSAFSLRMNQFFYQPSRSNFIASTSTFGSSTFPTPMQLQASAPNYFRAFQMYRAAPIGGGR